MSITVITLGYSQKHSLTQHWPEWSLWKSRRAPLPHQSATPSFCSLAVIRCFRCRCSTWMRSPSPGFKNTRRGPPRAYVCLPWKGALLICKCVSWISNAVPLPSHLPVPFMSSLVILLQSGCVWQVEPSIFSGRWEVGCCFPEGIKFTSSLHTCIRTPRGTHFPQQHQLSSGRRAVVNLQDFAGFYLSKSKQGLSFSRDLIR